MKDELGENYSPRKIISQGQAYGMQESCHDSQSITNYRDGDYSTENTNEAFQQAAQSSKRTAGDGDSVWSSMHNQQLGQSSVFDYRENQSQQKRSLAQDLKKRRELKERLSIERMNNFYHNTDAQTPGVNKAADTLKRRAAVPMQSDNSGTMFRIRPQTPRLNLLNKGKHKHVKLASLDQNPASAID